MRRTSDKDRLSFETDTPFNEPDQFDAHGFSLWFGHGKVNAAKAVKAAGDRAGTPTLIDQSVAPGSVIPDVGVPVQSFINIGGGSVDDLCVQVATMHTHVGNLRST